jgi:hypothetical protein
MSPNPSYADVARNPPGSYPSNLRTLFNQTTPSTLTDTLYCIVDVSNVEEADRALETAPASALPAGTRASLLVSRKWQRRL